MGKRKRRHRNAVTCEEMPNRAKPYCLLINWGNHFTLALSPPLRINSSASTSLSLLPPASSNVVSLSRSSFFLSWQARTITVLSLLRRPQLIEWSRRIRVRCKTSSNYSSQQSRSVNRVFGSQHPPAKPDVSHRSHVRSRITVVCAEVCVPFWSQQPENSLYDLC